MFPLFRSYRFSDIARTCGTVAAVAVFLFLLFSSCMAQADAVHVVRDKAGRNVIIPENPCRVISLTVSIAETVYLIGKGDCLAGTVSYTDYPEEAAKLPVVGPYNKPELEKIIALKPDLCIASKDGNPEETVKKIESFGIPVYVTDTQGITGIFESIRSVGMILGADVRAEDLIADMKNRIKAVEKKIAAASVKPRMVFQVHEDPLIMAGRGTFIDEMIKIAGGENLVRGNSDYPKLSREKLIAMMPDIVILGKMMDGGCKKTWWLKFPYIPAVRNNHVYNVAPDIFLRPGPRMVDGIEKLARILHPEMFLAHEVF